MLFLFATHYCELTDLPIEYPTISNVRLDAIEKNDDITFLHEVREGATNKSFGIAVARKAGVPLTVIKKAREILKKLKKRIFRFQNNFPPPFLIWNMKLSRK